jgi:hypothetical protein
MNPMQQFGSGYRGDRDIHVGDLAREAVHIEQTAFNIDQNTRINQRSHGDSGSGG